MTLLQWIGLALLGGLGAAVRDVLERGIGTWHGLFFVNVLGSFALGLLVGTGVHGDARWLLATGFLGAFTTFSAWALEPRSRGVAMLAVGLLAVWLGRTLG